MFTSNATVQHPTGIDAKPKRQRSAVTNGRRTFVDGDGNSAWSRRRQDLILMHEADAGGRDNLSTGQLALIRSAAAIEVQLEQLEGKMSKGETVDILVFTAAVAQLRRLLETLGVERAMGWRETVVNKHGGKDGGAIKVVFSQADNEL